MVNEIESPLEDFLQSYCENVQTGFSERMEGYTPEIYDQEVSDSIGGLLARQSTLAMEFARNPGIWNGHVAPLVLRCMTDTHITLAWIAKDPIPRSKEYVSFGLGQEKLIIEYLESEANDAPEEEIGDDINRMVEVRRNWLRSQLMEWAAEVNVGNWSGKSTREMAMESGCESLYKFAYVPFSGVAHSMWHHVARYNLIHCQAPLHKSHRIPITPDVPIDPDYLYRSAKYVSRTFILLDETLGLVSQTPLPGDYFVDQFPFGDSDATEADS